VTGTHGALVLGAAQLGQAYGNGPDRNPPSAETVAHLLHQAARLGITEVDTARAYGESEQVVGVAAEDLPGLRIVTKVRPLDPGATRADEVVRAVTGSVAESVRTLRRQVLDTVLLHRTDDLRVADGVAGDVLERLVAQGTARRWGVSIATPDDLLFVLDRPGVHYVQLPFNLLDRRWLAPEVSASLAARPDVRVVVRSALLQGLVASTDTARWPTFPDVDAVRMVGSIGEAVTTLGRADRVDLALAYVLAHPWVDAIVAGVRRVDQLTALAAAVTRPVLTANEITVVHRLVPAGPADLIDPSRWQRPAVRNSHDRDPQGLR
jgi:aryl-alcohol dehydrogenase-like predicted oxidoreductase